ncbi:MAG: DUF485 domain-containing protein [Armatimonadota bacterium]|nr:DUF485 domain-containing protein [Armatimonadota bacterium]MDR5698141.1 DUF485 domain-containing protein [Armatimonadota bacterium]
MTSQDEVDSVLWNYPEFDTPEEVEAVFRAQRRLTFGHAALFFAGTLLLPVLQALWDPWVTLPIWGGLTPAFVAATIVYPLFCVLLAISYTMRANRLEEDLLERHRDDSLRPGSWAPPGGR